MECRVSLLLLACSPLDKEIYEATKISLREIHVLVYFNLASNRKRYSYVSIITHVWTDDI